MSEPDLALTAEAQSTLEKMAARFPPLVAAIERQVVLRIENGVHRLRGPS